MNDRAVADGDVGTDGQGVVVFAVDDGVVLDIGPWAYGDGSDVAANGDAEPDVDIDAEGDVAADASGVGDVDVIDVSHEHGVKIVMALAMGCACSYDSRRLWNGSPDILH